MSPGELGFTIGAEAKFWRSGSAVRLTPQCKALSQQRRQARIQNLLLGRVNVVVQSANLHVLALNVINGIRGTPIAVAWLAGTADIHEILGAAHDLGLQPASSAERCHLFQRSAARACARRSTAA